MRQNVSGLRHLTKRCSGTSWDPFNRQDRGPGDTARHRMPLRSAAHHLHNGHEKHNHDTAVR